MRGILCAVALLAMAFSGCAEGPAVIQEETFSEDLDEQLEATATTGVIRGVVIDETVTPVVGVTVTVMSDGRSTTTDENGFFGFSDLEEGTYFLSAQRLGYGSVQSSAEVLAGVDDPAIVRISMVRDASQLPYIDQDQWDGYIVCSIRPGTGNNAGSVGVNACNGVAEQDVNRPHIEFAENATFVQTEMVWDSTQASGDELSLVVGPPNCADIKYARYDGPSPAVYRLDKEDLEDEEIGPDKTLCTRTFTYTSGTFLHFWGMQLEQGFSVFFHHFYNMVPEEEWLFVIDGTHPIPS